MNYFSREFFNLLRLHTKDTIFTHTYEHLSRSIRLARSSGYPKEYRGVILDVGAYDGKTTLFLRESFPECSVHAFEPNPEAFSILEQNTQACGKIIRHKEALSDTDGTCPLYVTHNKVSSSLNKILTDSPSAAGTFTEQLKVNNIIQIPMVRLDALGFDEILLLKMDTQGNEVRVIEGGMNTIRKTQFIVTEMSVHKLYENGCSYFETDAKLRELGFEPYDFIVPARKNGVQMTEFDAIYVNKGRENN